MQKSKAVLRQEPKYSKDPLLQKQVGNVLANAQLYIKNLFSELSDDNMRTVVEFLTKISEVEKPRPNTRRAYIINLVLLSRFYNHVKPFREYTRQEVLTFLQSYRKDDDPTERWINTYNLKTTILLKFFKWLYYPDMDFLERRKAPKPAVVSNLPLFKRRNKSTVQAKDLWLPEEDRIFLKYCRDLRLCLYHTLADDSSGRPHELLALRFCDIMIKTNAGRIYGEVEIGRGGKTNGRTVPLITSIPYFRQWQSQNADPTAYIFRANSPQAKYKNLSLSVTVLGNIYKRQQKYFASLLERSDVPEEDKVIVRNLLHRRWNPYIKRHSSLTEKARLLKNDYSLRLHAGWAKNSKMAEIYTHELGGESSQELLAAYGVVPKATDGKIQMLAPKICPLCNEPNMQDAKFCANKKCGMPLTYDAYEELKEKDRLKEQQMNKTESDMTLIMEFMTTTDTIRKAKLAEQMSERIARTG